MEYAGENQREAIRHASIISYALKSEVASENAFMQKALRKA